MLPAMCLVPQLFSSKYPRDPKNAFNIEKCFSLSDEALKQNSIIEKVFYYKKETNETYIKICLIQKSNSNDNLKTNSSPKINSINCANIYDNI
ncbi:hypothetical protein LRB78_01030 [Borreliella americana]|uniref:hypothetical protein n=1 Tax=Borreliella americana TaxID=478807 RepID=UPI001E457874|nr:hypothetical protein [Borreliella americana]MCD2349274.1 hypothetical protein [Borreliella americana]